MAETLKRQNVETSKPTYKNASTAWGYAEKSANFC